MTSLADKHLAARSAEPRDARRARLVLTGAGRRLYDEIFPQVAATNANVMAALDDTVAAALDGALRKLTARAVQLNSEVARDVRADRQACGSRRVRNWPDAQD